LEVVRLEDSADRPSLGRARR